MKGAYKVFLKKTKNSFSVYIPDWDIYTEGTDLPDALEMARDAIGIMGIDCEDDGVDFPEIRDHVKTDEFDLESYVDVDFEAYRRKLKNLSVKKNCTIPAWLNDKAEAEGINFSKVLQEGLVNLVGSK